MGSLEQFGVDQGDSGCGLEGGDGEGGPGTRCAVLSLGMGSCSVAQDGGGVPTCMADSPSPSRGAPIADMGSLTSLAYQGCSRPLGHPWFAGVAGLAGQGYQDSPLPQSWGQ